MLQTGIARAHGRKSQRTRSADHTIVCPAGGRGAENRTRGEIPGRFLPIEPWVNPIWKSVGTVSELARYGISITRAQQTLQAAVWRRNGNHHR